MPRRPRHTFAIERPVLKIVGRKSARAANKKGAIQAFKSWCRFAVEKTCREKPMRKIKKKVVSKRLLPQRLKTQPNPIDSLRYEFACKKLTLSQSLRSGKEKGQENRRQIQFGNYLIDTWFTSPYPPEVYAQSRFFVCEFCFVSIKTAAMAKRHQEKCCVKCPPGNEIYRQGNVSIFEVDGQKNKMYCLNLCLLTKLFLDHKTLFYDVEPFLFYIMTETDQDGCHFVGYFSKEKKSFMNCNVSCILILPTHQRKGYGQYLIDFSYLLTRRESKVGTPEKPLSALGSLGYQRYWDYTVLKHFSSKKHEQFQSIDDISTETGMTPDDIIAALQRNNLLRLNDGHYELHINQRDIEKQLAKIESKIQLRIDPTKLMWTPPSCSPVYMDTM
ncbi:histone acetyltransferase KAT7 isoform 6 [Mucor ambiguus]|uniref:Histone acetyltransferase n=1 Tax=Mucor ambiguus TaxID=91626 RepID=A0A0C9M0I2_9FUNG|nr:histone acetyltransferase KAT7 isoform 6 [Mucor ambiguus]